MKKDVPNHSSIKESCKRPIQLELDFGLEPTQPTRSSYRGKVEQEKAESIQPVSDTPPVQLELDLTVGSILDRLSSSAYLSYKDLGSLLGVSRSTLYRWVDCNNLPAPEKIGIRKVGFKSAQIIAWIQSREAVK